MGKAAGLLFVCCLAWLAATFVGCKPGVPKEHIQPGKMEDILYDYHVADGMAYLGDYQELPFRRKAYREAALRKHGVTEAQFDSSLVYYYRHTELLHDIYEKLSKRLNNDAIALGATANELSQFEGMSSQGDTATVWSNKQPVVLMPVAPYNYVTFDIKADTTYHEGDKMILSFDNKFLFQSGMRDGVAMLAVTFKNDSTASQVMHCSSDNHTSLQIQDNGRIGIKRVTGFVYLGRGNENNMTSELRVLAISNLKLMKMHTAPQTNENEQDNLNNNHGPEAAPLPGGGPLGMPVRTHPEVLGDEPEQNLNAANDGPQSQGR